MSDNNALDTPIEVTSRLALAIKNATTSSLPEFTKVTRVSPVVLVEESIANMDPTIVNNLVQTLLNIYAGMYLTAITLTMTVGDVRVIRLLDSMATDRDLLTSAGHSTWVGNESYYGLESLSFAKKEDDEFQDPAQYYKSILDDINDDNDDDSDYIDDALDDIVDMEEDFSSESFQNKLTQLGLEEFDNGNWVRMSVYLPLTKEELSGKSVSRLGLKNIVATTKENIVDYINSSKKTKAKYVGYCKFNLTKTMGRIISLPVKASFKHGDQLMNFVGKIKLTTKDMFEITKINQYSKEAFTIQHTSLPSMEANSKYNGTIIEQALGVKGNDLGDRGVYDKTIVEIKTPGNLAVGKLIEVKFESGEKSVSVPVAVTLFPKLISGNDFVTIVAANTAERSIVARWHQWRSGEIKFIMDSLLCLDLIEADRKALKADKDGVLLNARSKRTRGIGAALLSGYASPNTVSTMAIVSKNTARNIEFAMKRQLKDPRTREIFFENNSLMLLVVVDVDMERFTLYYRGIAEISNYTFTDIKDNGKKASGVDIEGVIKAYKVGNAPML